MQVKKQQLEPGGEQWTGSKLGKKYVKAVYCYPAYSYDADYIMRNARLDEVQAGIKSAGRNINNLRYADDTTLMAVSEEELKSLLVKVKEDSEKAGLKFNIQKTKIIASHNFMANRWGKSQSSDRLFSWAPKSLLSDCSHEIKTLAP